MEDEELIRKQMEQTRESLTEKLEALEEKVAHSVTTVTDTVAQVKESLHEGAEVVKDTVHESVETVKGVFDVPEHFRTHPWMAFGGAVACGYVLGSLLPSQAPVAQTMALASAPTSTKQTHGNGKHKEHRSSSLARASSAASSWMDMLKPEIDMLKGLALGATLGVVRELITHQVPPQMGEQIRTIIDGVTQKLGGDPVPSSDFESVAQNSPSSTGSAGMGGSRWQSNN